MPPPNHAWAAAASATDKSHSRKVFAHSSASGSAYTRHLQATDAYLRYYGGSIPELGRARSERDIIEENHQFIRQDDNEVDDKDEEKTMARKYYEKLFKEFAVVELARWREKQIAMRWRTKEEVLKGKGQFSCANLSCRNRDTLDEDPNDDVEEKGDKKGLQGFELMFEYVEGGEQKNALVKVRVCDECTTKLRHIQGSDEKRKERHKRSRDKGEDRSQKSRHRSESRSREERKRRKEDYKNNDKDRSRSRRKHRERRRSRSPKKGGEGDRLHRLSSPGESSARPVQIS